MAVLFIAAGNTPRPASEVVDIAVELRDELMQRSKENKLGL